MRKPRPWIPMGLAAASWVIGLGATWLLVGSPDGPGIVATTGTTTIVAAPSLTLLPPVTRTSDSPAATASTLPGTPETPGTAPAETAPPATPGTPATPATTAALVFVVEAENYVIAATNDLRASLGLPTLTVDVGLRAYARDWARSMAERQTLSHSATGQLLGDWARVGENIGSDGGISLIFGALTASPSHYLVLVGPDYTHTGVGVVADASGSLWLCQVVAGAGPLPTAPLPTAPLPTAPLPLPSLPAIPPIPVR